MAANRCRSMDGAPNNSKPRRLRSLVIALCVGVAASVGSAMPAHAVPIATMLDDYDVHQYVSTPAGINALAADAVMGSMVGGYRGAFVQKTSGSSSEFLRVEALDDTTDGASTFNVSRSSQIGGVALLQWDGDNNPPNAFNPTSSLNTSSAIVDLTSNSSAGIVIRMLSADLAGQQLTINLFGVGGDPNLVSRAQQTVVLPSIAGATDILFPWANFAEIGFGALDYTNVSAITLSITGPVGSDLTMDYIATYVPEPASVSILTMGAAALVTHSLRKRRRAVTEIATNA